VEKLHIYSNGTRAYLATKSLDEAFIQLPDDSNLTIIYDDCGYPISEETHTCNEWIKKLGGPRFIGLIKITKGKEYLRGKWLKGYNKLNIYN
jgi:hypothetical protein